MQLNIASFNVKGFKPRNFDFLKFLSNKMDIILFQETWLYEREKHVMEKVLLRHTVFHISSMNQANIDKIGRPYGGCAVAINRSINASINKINTICSRLCAVTVENREIKLLIFSVYMPVNDGTMVSFREFGDVLSEVSSIINIYNTHQIILAGDFNVDFNLNSIKI